MSLRRGVRYATAFAALLGALLVSASAAAATETFRFFEVNADANYTVVDQCADGTTRTRSRHRRAVATREGRAGAREQQVPEYPKPTCSTAALSAAIARAAGISLERARQHYAGR